MVGQLQQSRDCIPHHGVTQIKGVSVWCEAYVWLYSSARELQTKMGGVVVGQYKVLTELRVRVCVCGVQCNKPSVVLICCVCVYMTLVTAAIIICTVGYTHSTHSKIMPPPRLINGSGNAIT